MLFLTLTSWTVLGLLFCGVGLLIRRAFGLRDLGAEVLFVAFWLGWSAVVAALQIWHLRYRIGPWTLAGAAAAGILGLVLHRVELGVMARRGGRRWPALLLLGLVVLWVAGRAQRPVWDIDTGLYTQPTLEWWTAYPAVPGLGNLHGRLALNSSFLLYAAALEVGPWATEPRCPANGLLLLAVLAQSAWCFGAFFSRRRSPGGEELFGGFLLGPIAARVLSSNLSSLSTDLPAFALNVAVSFQLLALLSRRRPAGAEGDFRLLALVAAAVAGTTVKLSAAAFAAVALAAAAIVRLRQAGGGRWRRALPALGAGLLLALPWALRSVVLSGYLVFPGGLGAIDVDWRIPRILVLEYNHWISSWARQPGAHWMSVLGGWDWLGPWLVRFPEAMARLLLIAAAGMAVAGWRLFSRRAAASSMVAVVVLLPPVAELVYCFFTAPDPRFAGAAFEVLAAAALAVAASAAKPRHLRLLAVGLTAFLVIPAWLAAPERVTPRPGYDTRITDSGLAVHVVHETPQGSLCWDIPPPCTPYFRPGLRLRVDGDLGRGFRLDHGSSPPMLIQQTPGLTAVPPLGIAPVSGWRRRGGELVMTTAGRLALYAERPTAARLRLRPRTLRVGSRAVEKGELRFSFNGAGLSRVELPVDEVVLALPLPADFSLVTVEVGAGEAAPAPGGETGGLRFVSIAFETVELAPALPHERPQR